MTKTWSNSIKIFINKQNLINKKLSTTTQIASLHLKISPHFTTLIIIKRTARALINCIKSRCKQEIYFATTKVHWFNKAAYSQMIASSPYASICNSFQFDDCRLMFRIHFCTISFTNSKRVNLNMNSMSNFVRLIVVLLMMIIFWARFLRHWVSTMNINRRESSWDHNKSSYWPVNEIN